MASFAAVQALHRSWGGRPIVDGRVTGGDFQKEAARHLFCVKSSFFFLDGFFWKEMPEKTASESRFLFFFGESNG